MRTSVQAGRCLAVAALAAALVAGCGDSGGSAEGEDATIHAIASQTGPGAPYGELMTQGSELAVETVNDDGGIDGSQVSLETEDDGSEAARGVTILQRIAPDSSVAVLNTISSVFAQVAPVSNDLELPTLGSAISASSLIADNQPWTWTLFPNLAQAVPGAVEVWKRQEDLSRVAMIYDNQFEGTVAQAKLYADGLRDADVELTEQVAVATQDVNFGAAVGRALRGDPQGVVVPALPEQAGAIVRAVRNADPDVSIFIPTAGFVPQVLRRIAGDEALDGVYTVQSFFAGKGAPEGAQTFAKQFTDKYSNPPDSTAAHAYESILVLQQAGADGAFSPGDVSLENRESLRDYMASLDWDGPFGKVKMGDDGVAERAFYVLQMDDSGTPTLAETIGGDSGS